MTTCARLLALLVLAFVAGCGKNETAKPDDRPAFRAMVTATGKSMLPTFGESEVVDVEFCRYGELRGNDTVIRWDPIFKLYVHHRLESRDQTGLWTTRGDNNPVMDRGHMTAETFIARTHKR